MAKSLLVLGVGNTLFTDDGAGVLAVRQAASRWPSSGPDGVDFGEAAAGGLELLDLLAGYEGAIVVDAAITGQAEPGECYLLDPESLPALAGQGAHGAHLGTALEAARRMGVAMPRHVMIMAIEAVDIATLGEGLTPAVAAGIAPAAEAILRAAREIRQVLEREVDPGA